MTWSPALLPPTPAASNEHVRLRFSRARRRDTAPELALRRAMFALGMRFLVDVAPAGTDRRRRADVVLRGPRIAVLVHGCFWHSCPAHLHLPKSNAEWWSAKLASITARDADTLLRLHDAGWLPHVVWEHEDMNAAALRLQVLARERG